MRAPCDLARALATLGLGLALGGCIDGDSAGNPGGENQAPVIEPPLPISFKEDDELSVTIHVYDLDGDELTVQHSGSTAIGSVSQAFIDGANHLELEVVLAPPSNFFGNSSFALTAFDGAIETEERISYTVSPQNDRPIARDDHFAALVDTPLTIPAIGVLGNDDDEVDLELADPPYQGLSIDSLGAATHGSVTLTGGAIQFVPEAGFSGTASFDYTLVDGGWSVTASVRILVGGPNAAPVAVDDAMVHLRAASFQLEPSWLLADDHDADANTLFLIDVANATNATVELVDGAITIVPDTVTAGVEIGFDYTITDGAATATAHARVELY